MTHDQVEAMTMADRIAIMRAGVIQQIGTPLPKSRKRPANRFVAEFIGSPAMNFIDVTVHSEAGATAVEAAGLRLTVSAADARGLAAYGGRRVILGVRPEHLALGDGAPGAGFDARVEVVEQLGSEILLETRVGSHSVTVARVAAETPIARGDQVRLSAQLGRLHFFDPETELPVPRLRVDTDLQSADAHGRDPKSTPRRGFWQWISAFTCSRAASCGWNRWMPEHKEEIRATIDCDPASWSIMLVNPVGEGFEEYWSASCGCVPGRAVTLRYSPLIGRPGGRDVDLLHGVGKARRRGDRGRHSCVPMCVRARSTLKQKF